MSEIFTGKLHAGKMSSCFGWKCGGTLVALAAIYCSYARGAATL
jgi:hypothetical protein